MNQVHDEVIYRVRAVASDHWVVYRDTGSDPVASFSDKACALAYALDLARHMLPARVIEYSSPERF